VHLLFGQEIDKGVYWVYDCLKLESATEGGDCTVAPCKVHIEHDNRVTVVKLKGTLEHGNVISVKVQIEQVLQAGNLLVIIDFDGVTHANSDGLGSIISVKKMQATYSAKIMMINVHGKAADLIKQCQLDQILPIRDLSLTEAKIAILQEA